MAEFFSSQYQWLWTVALGGALFFPIRRLIWVIAVRRAEARHGPADDAGRATLKRRAGATAALICFIIAVLYVNHLFQGRP